MATDDSRKVREAIEWTYDPRGWHWAEHGGFTLIVEPLRFIDDGPGVFYWDVGCIDHKTGDMIARIAGGFSPTRLLAHACAEAVARISSGQTIVGVAKS